MKLIHFKKNGVIRLGIETDKGVVDVLATSNNAGIQAPVTLDELLQQGDDGARAIEELVSKTGTLVIEQQVIYAPAVPNPGKIMCIGLNYKSHAQETEGETPLFPVLFSKFNNSLAANDEAIVLPKCAHDFDYEAELVIIMGKHAFCISKEDAASYIFGYTAGNDLSARDLQFRSGLLGKSCDRFAPIGPRIVTADELDPRNLSIECYVNGERKQADNTKNMLFDCAYIVSYLSQHFTLEPGDIIFTGTPAGVILGQPRERRRWLASGDEVTVTIEGIGQLKNKLV